MGLTGVSRQPRFVAHIVFGILCWTLSACSSSSLSEELVGPTADLLVSRAEAVELVLSEDDAECAARRLDELEALALEAAVGVDQGLPPDVARVAADAIIECAGTQVIARSALAPFIGGASEASQRCAGERLDQALLAELVAGQLADDPLPRAEVELAVVTSVSLCLSPEELRGRG